MTLLGWRAISLLSVFGVGGCVGDSQSRTDCRVAIVNPRGGEMADIGRQVSRALTLVTDSLRNESIRVRIDELNSGGNPATARAEVERVLGGSRPVVIVGSILSSETKEFLPIALRAGVVVLANGSSDPGIRNSRGRRAYDGFFRNWPADDLEGIVFAEYLIQAGVRRLAVINADDAYANALTAAFTGRFTALGGTVVRRERYPTDIARLSPVVGRALALPIDGLYAIGFPSDLAPVYVALRSDARGKNLPMYSGVGVASGDFRKKVGIELDRLLYTAPAVDESSPAYVAFKASYARKFDGEVPDAVAAVTFDALWMAIRAIQSVGCSADSVKQYLYSMQAYPGASGATAFDSLGDVVTKPVAINAFEHGRERLIERRARRP